MEFDFPYRKYQLESKVKLLLSTLISSKPNISTDEKWSLMDTKVIKNIPNSNEIFYLSNVVIKPSLNNHWDYDIIVDYYNEEARIKSKGYGEKFSVWEYWNNLNLHKRWKKINIRNYNKEIDNRELLYKSITEARPAYTSVSISLYKALSSLLLNLSLQNLTISNNQNPNISILDISAYGERAIAAATLDYSYDGIDPNYDLISGHTKLLMDLKTLKDCNIQFYYTELENFKSNKLYDIITYSPPPFNTEIYSESKKELQTYFKYSTKEEYICNFLTEIMYKALLLCKENGVFSITALDRTKEHFPNIPKEYISDNLELIYVELMLLIISSFGFKYVGAIGLSSGDKPANIPWWTFIKQRKNNSYESMILFKKYYNNIYQKVGPRCLSVLNNDDLFEQQIKKFNIEDNVFEISNHEFVFEKSIIVELVRFIIQNYVVDTVYEVVIKNNYNKLQKTKIKNILGRYLMLRSITSSFYKPWHSCLYVDPVFPTNNVSDELRDDLNKIDKQIIKNLNDDYDEESDNLEGTIGEQIMKNEIYWFKSYTCKGIEELYNTIAHYMRTIVTNDLKYTIKETKKEYLIKLINFNDIPGYLNNIIRINNFDKVPLLIVIRYETLGARGHQYTRPLDKTKIIESIFNHKLIDIYASYFNNQSDYYCSIYPDIEPKSVGSAFNLVMKEGAFMANPVDVPIFVEKSVYRVIYDLVNAKKDSKKLMISMAFTLWLDNDLKFMNLFHKLNHIELLKNTKNKGLQLLSTVEFIRSIYILDKNKFPSTFLTESIANSRENTISVGIILTSEKNLINKEKIKLLSLNDYYRYI